MCYLEWQYKREHSQSKKQFRAVLWILLWMTAGSTTASSDLWLGSRLHHPAKTYLLPTPAAQGKRGCCSSMSTGPTNSEPKCTLPAKCAHAENTHTPHAQTHTKHHQNQHAEIQTEPTASSLFPFLAKQNEVGNTDRNAVLVPDTRSTQPLPLAPPLSSISATWARAAPAVGADWTAWRHQHQHNPANCWLYTTRAAW